MRVEIRQFKSLFTFWLLKKSPNRDFDLKMLAGKLWFLIPYVGRGLLVLVDGKQLYLIGGARGQIPKLEWRSVLTDDNVPDGLGRFT
jgi:hypothetical protein